MPYSKGTGAPAQRVRVTVTIDSGYVAVNAPGLFEDEPYFFVGAGSSFELSF